MPMYVYRNDISLKSPSTSALGLVNNYYAAHVAKSIIAKRLCKLRASRKVCNTNVSEREHASQWELIGKPYAQTLPDRNNKSSSSSAYQSRA